MPGISAGVVFVDVVPNMAAFAAEVESGVTGAAASAEAAVAGGTAAGVEKGATASSKSKGVLGSFKQLAKLAAAVFAFEFAKKSVEAFDTYQAGLMQLTESLKRAGIEKALPDLKAWTASFSNSTGIAQTDLLKLEKAFATFGLKGTTQIEDLTNATQGLSQLTGKSISLFMRSLIPSILNSPKSALAMFLKLHIATAGQLADVQKLIDHNKTHAASQALLNLFIEKGKDAYKTTPIEKFKTTIQNLEIFIGGKLVPVIDKLVSAVTSVITWFEKGGAVADTFKSVLLALLTAFVAFKAITGVIKLVEALNLAMEANPYVFIVAAVIALVIIIIKNWGTIKRVTLEVWNAVKRFTLKVWGDILGFLKRWGPLALAVMTGGISLLVGLVVKNWGKIKKTTTTVFNAVRDFLKKWGKLIFVIMTGGLGLIVTTVLKHWTAIKKGTTTAFNAVLGFVKKWWKLLLAVVTAGASVIVMFVLDHWSQIRKGTVKAWNAVKDFVLAVVRGIKAGVMATFNALAAGVQAIWNGMKAVAQSIWNNIKGVVLPIVNAIKTGIVDAINGLKAVWAAVWGAILASAHALIDPVISIISTLVGWLEKAKDLLGKVAGAIGGALGGIAHFVGFASGTVSAPAGFAVVGEKGPELVRFRGGEQVVPHERMGAFLRNVDGGSKAGDTFNVNVTGSQDPGAAATRMVRTLRRYQRLHARVLDAR